MAVIQYGGGTSYKKSAKKSTKVQYKAPKPMTDQQRWAQLMGEDNTSQVRSYGNRTQQVKSQMSQAQKNAAFQKNGGRTPSGATWRNETNYGWLGNDYRERYSSSLMTLNEYLKRRQAWQGQYGNQFLQSQDEWTRRNNVAPAGYMYQPFGSGYARLNTAGQQQSPQQNYGNSYAGNYGGGGGGGYQAPMPEWWLAMVNWRI